MLLTEFINFLSIIFFSGEQSDELKLPKWVKVNKKRFNEILSTVTKVKNDRLRINADRRDITLDNTENLLKDLGNGILDGHEFKNRYNDVAYDVEVIVNKTVITRNREKIIMSLLKEILRTKSDEKPNITDMPELESKESVAKRRNQQGQGLKILIPYQMLSRLPIILAQLKAAIIHKNLNTKLENYSILCTVQKI